MNKYLPTAFAALLGLMIAATARADGPGPSTVAIYLAPDASTPAYVHLSATDARLSNVKPSADAAQAASGWQTADMAGPVTGYVAKDKTLNSAVLKDTPIHSAEKADSPVLGTAPDSPIVKVANVDGDWAEVSYAGPVTVYFLKIPTPVSTAPATTPVAAAPAPAPAAATPAPAPVIAAPTRPTAVTPVAAVPASTTPAPIKAAPTDIARYYYGSLKFRTNPITAGPINAQYLLYASDGTFVALVDLSGVVLPNPVASYLGKPVKIYGTPYTMSSLPSVVIRATMLQLN